MAYQTIIVEVEDHVGTIRLNRPDALNALNHQLLDELGDALTEMDASNRVRAIVVTGSDKAFAAGADVKEMAPKGFVEMFVEDYFTGPTETIMRCRKPIIAAVAGYCLGGGCELAMTCDFIIAADTAKFGQPEINLGVMPGPRRHPAADPLRRQVEGDGDVPDRALHGRRRGRALRPRQPGGAGQGPAARGARDRDQDRREVAARRSARSRRRSTAATRPRCARASCSSAGCSTRSSPPRTRPRAWPPSPRSAARSSAAGSRPQGIGIRGCSIIASAVAAEHPRHREHLVPDPPPRQRQHQLRPGDPPAPHRQRKLQLRVGDHRERQHDREGSLRRLDAGEEAEREHPSNQEAGERRQRHAEPVVDAADPLGGEPRQHVDPLGDVRIPPRPHQHVVRHPEGPVAGQRPDHDVQHPVPEALEARGGEELEQGRGSRRRRQPGSSSFTRREGEWRQPPPTHIMNAA